MNNFQIKQTMALISVATLVIFTLSLSASLFFSSYPVSYSNSNGSEILYEGEVIEITYWNVTVEKINLHYLNYEIRNHTYELCNFTILNGTSNKKLKLTTYADYFVDEVEIGDTVIFYHSQGNIWDIEIIKKEVTE